MGKEMAVREESDIAVTNGDDVLWLVVLAVASQTLRNKALRVS